MGCIDTSVDFLRKFFSVIIGVLIAIFTLMFLISAASLINKQKSFSKSGFAYFLAILISIATAISYIVLHLVPRKAYRLMYALTGMLLLAFFFMGHSLGFAGPTVTDCHRRGELSVYHLTDSSHYYNDLHDLLTNNVSYENVTLGYLGQRVEYCSTHGVVFVAALLLMILYFIAIFDVQKVLLTRVRSKTYGERFVEMGISS